MAIYKRYTNSISFWQGNATFEARVQIFYQEVRYKLNIWTVGYIQSSNGRAVRF